MSKEKSYKDFRDMLYKIMCKRNPDTEIKIITNTKQNDTCYGLTFFKEGSNVSPTFYLERVFKEWQEGNVGFREIAEYIEEQMQNADLQIPQGLNLFELFSDFDKIKDRIYYTLVNTKANEKMLEELVHEEVMDLSKVYRIDLHDLLGSNANIKIGYKHLDIFGVSEDVIKELAEKNTERIMPASITLMDDILKTLVDEDVYNKLMKDKEDGVYTPLYIVNSMERANGAGVILYDSTIKQLKEVVGERFYVIPSSVHEMIVVECSHEESVSLDKIISEVNDMLEPVEILSNHSYYFDGKRLRDLRPRY